MKILIVEPDWSFSQQATEYLESRAHLVVHQSRPAEAIGKADHWQPDLVIVASEMAETGILEALSQLDRPPAILLTGWMDRYDAAWRAWQRGGDELLIKPVFKVAELQEAIVTALENAATGVHSSRRAISSA